MNPSDQSSSNAKKDTTSSSDMFDDPLSGGASRQRTNAIQNSRDFAATGSGTSTTTSTGSLAEETTTRKKGVLGALDGKLKKKEPKETKEVKTDPLSGGTVIEKPIVEEKPKDSTLTDRNSLFEPLTLKTDADPLVSRKPSASPILTTTKSMDPLSKGSDNLSRDPLGMNSNYFTSQQDKKPAPTLIKQHSQDSPTRSRRKGSVEMNIPTVSGYDNDQVFDMVLYKDEFVKMRNQKRKVVIQNYLELDTIRIDNPINHFKDGGRSMSLAGHSSFGEDDTPTVRKFEDAKKENKSSGSSNVSSKHGSIIGAGGSFTSEPIKVNPEKISEETKSMLESYDPRLLEENPKDPISENNKSSRGDNKSSLGDTKDTQKGSFKDKVPAVEIVYTNTLTHLDISLPDICDPAVIFSKQLFTPLEKKQAPQKKVIKSTPIDIKAKPIFKPKPVEKPIEEKPRSNTGSLIEPVISTSMTDFNDGKSEESVSPTRIGGSEFLSVDAPRLEHNSSIHSEKELKEENKSSEIQSTDIEKRDSTKRSGEITIHLNPVHSDSPHSRPSESHEEAHESASPVKLPKTEQQPVSLKTLSESDMKESKMSIRPSVEEFINRQKGKEVEHKEIIKEEEEPEHENIQREEGTIQIPEDPLDNLEKIDEDSEMTPGGPEPTMDLDSAFMVTKNPLLSSYKLKMVKEIACDGLNKTLYSNQKKFDATIVRFFPPKYTFVGTSSSSVHIFDSEDKLVKTLEYKEGPKQSVTALDFSNELPNFEHLVVGFSGGHIAVYDLIKFSCMKAIPTVLTAKITSIKIIQLDPLIFILSDESGEIYYFTIEKLLSFYTEKHVLVKKIQNSFAIDILNMRRELRVFNTENLEDEDSLRHLFAIATLDKVMIAHNKKTDFELKWTFERPDNVSDDSLPCIAWGKSYYKDDNLKTYLLIGWGNIIYLIELKLDRFIFDFKVIAFLELEHPVIYIFWIAESMAMVLDKKNMVNFVNCNEFVEGKYSPEIKIEEKAMIFSQYLEFKLVQRLSFTDRKKNSIPFLSASITSSETAHESLMMGDTSFRKIKYLSALEYLDTLVAEKDWLKFMTISVQIYEGNIPELYGVARDPKKRQADLTPFIEKRVKVLLDHLNSEDTKNEQYYKEIVLSLSDFLTAIKDFKFLFGEVQKTLAKLGFQSYFYDSLEPFIVLNRITYIPDDSLRNVILWYCGKSKKNIMQQLIFSLDLTRQDSFLLMHLCLEFSLYSALIRICNIMDDNYTTPLVKLINDYKLAKAMSRDEDAQTYGYRCLWYLKLCLKQKLTNKASGEKGHAKWKDTVFQIMVMIFEKEYLSILFEVDGELTINLILLFFNGELSSLIEENYGLVKIGGFGADVNQDDIHFQIYLSVKNLLQNASPEKKTVYNQYLGFFHGKIARLLRFSFLNRDLCVDFAKIFIAQPTLISDKLLLFWEKMHLEDQEKTPEEVRDALQKIKYDYIIEQRISIILDILKYVQYIMSSVVVDELIKSARLSQLGEVECCLLTINKRYVECMNVYLTGKAGPDSKAKTFDWLMETFSGFYDGKNERNEQDRHQMIDLKEAFIDKLPVLFKLNADYTKKIIDKFFNDKIGNVLKKFERMPELQLEILEKYLSNHDDYKEVDEELLVKHIYLLATTGRKNRKRIKEILSNNPIYPVAQCLEICKKQEIRDAWAYLEVRQGNVTMGIEIATKILEAKTRKYSKKPDFDYSKRKEKTYMMLDTIIDYLIQSGKASDKTWFDLMAKFFDIIDPEIQNKDDQNLKEQLVSLRDEIVDGILETMLKVYNSKDMIKNVEDRLDDLPEKLRGKFLLKIMQHNNHEQFILEYCKDLLISDIFTLTNYKLIPSLVAGCPGENSCHYCHEEVQNKDYALYFNCGHLFHNNGSCCPEGICRACKNAPERVTAKMLATRPTGIRARPGMVRENSNTAAKNVDEDSNRVRAETRTAKSVQNMMYGAKVDKLERGEALLKKRAENFETYTAKFMNW